MESKLLHEHEQQMSFKQRQRYDAELLDAQGRQMALEAQVALIFKVSGRWARALDKQPQGAVGCSFRPGLRHMGEGAEQAARGR